MEQFPEETTGTFDSYAYMGGLEQSSPDDILKLGSAETPSELTPTPTDYDLMRGTPAESVAPLWSPHEIIALQHVKPPESEPNPALMAPKHDLERFAGLMTEVFLDVVLPFDWPRSEMTVSAGADINNPASEPNRKPSWHEYF